MSTEFSKQVFGEILGKIDEDDGILQSLAFLSLDTVSGESAEQRSLLWAAELDFDRVMDKRLAIKCKGNANANKFHMMPSGRMERLANELKAEPGKTFADDLVEQFPPKPQKTVESSTSKPKVREEPVGKRNRYSKPEEKEESEEDKPSATGSFMSATKKLKIDDAKNGIKGRSLKSARKPSLGNKRYTQNDDQNIPSHIK